MEISSQIEAAVVLGEAGEPVASTLADARAAAELARTASALLAAAGRVRAEEGAPGLTQLEAATREGSVFVVRDGGRTIAATTAPSPTVGLVFYDLKTCLRALGEGADAKPKPRQRKRKEAEDADEA
jgi:predicted regulator of Ras-like GTPase activity (Roadblock/LC7/MglB family)